MEFSFSDGLKFALAADANDVLAGFKDKFFDSGEELIYLDGNSLGKMPARTTELLDEVTQKQWGSQLIRSWNSDWLDINKRIGAKIAALIGAKPNEVILTDSTSLNLFKLAYGSLKAQGSERNQILSDEMNFPSDLYILQGLMDVFGSTHKLTLAKSSDGISIDSDEIISHLNEKTALLTLSYVSFKSSFMYNMDRITKKAHDFGAHVIWDLSHALGAVPVDLGRSGVDMAVGCTYKYLNGGPGSIAFLYVREDLQDKIENPIWGWFADENPFEFELNFRKSNDIRRFTTSTTPILSAASIEPGLDIMIEAGMENVRKKSVNLSEYLIFLIDKHLLALGFSIGSPRNYKTRGSHVSIRHPEACRICPALINPIGEQAIVIPDFRSPDFIRIGITPLYLGYSDIYKAVIRLREIVETKEYLRFSNELDGVT